MEAKGIVKIWMFRDDILVLASERLKTHAYGRGMINRASFFITICEKVSQDKIEYLGCEVWIENGTIQSKPLIKPTNLGVLHKTHELPSCADSNVVASLYSSTPWRPQHVAQLRGRSKEHSHRKVCQAHGFTKPHQSITDNKYKPDEEIDERETSKWTQDVGHFPIPSGLVCTCCKSSQALLERRKLECHPISRISGAPGSC